MAKGICHPYDYAILYLTSVFTHRSKRFSLLDWWSKRPYWGLNSSFQPITKKIWGSQPRSYKEVNSINNLTEPGSGSSPTEAPMRLALGVNSHVFYDTLSVMMLLDKCSCQVSPLPLRQPALVSEASFYCCPAVSKSFLNSKHMLSWYCSSVINDSIALCTWSS